MIPVQCQARLCAHERRLLCLAVPWSHVPEPESLGRAYKNFADENIGPSCLPACLCWLSEPAMLQPRNVSGAQGPAVRMRRAREAAPEPRDEDMKWKGEYKVPAVG